MKTDTLDMTKIRESLELAELQAAAAYAKLGRLWFMLLFKIAPFLSLSKFHYFYQILTLKQICYNSY